MTARKKHSNQKSAKRSGQRAAKLTTRTASTAPASGKPQPHFEFAEKDGAPRARIQRARSTLQDRIQDELFGGQDYDDGRGYTVLSTAEERGEGGK